LGEPDLLDMGDALVAFYATDTDADGTTDRFDPDDDNDGVPDEADLFPENPYEWADFDSDSIGNNADLDDDNDGVADENDAFPRDPTRWEYISNFLSTNTVVVAEDSYIHMGQPTNNFGLDSLAIRGGGQKRYPYLKFNVGGLNGSVTQAVLRVYSETEGDLVEALAVNDSSWTEMGITWDNAPSRGTAIGSGQAVAGSWFSIDVTGYISSTGSYSIALNESGGSFGWLTSREGANAPYLEIITHAFDSDGDGISDTEEVDVLGTNPLLSDTDGDGMGDGREVLSGTNPLDEEDVFEVTSFSSEAEDVFSIQWKTVAGRNYSLWSNPSLSTGSWTQVQGPLAASNSALSISVTNSAPTLFYRIEVQIP
jgi:hypothetical protein